MSPEHGSRRNRAEEEVAEVEGMEETSRGIRKRRLSVGQGRRETDQAQCPHPHNSRKDSVGQMLLELFQDMGKPLTFHEDLESVAHLPLQGGVEELEDFSLLAFDRYSDER